MQNYWVRIQGGLWVGLIGFIGGREEKIEIGIMEGKLEVFQKDQYIDWFQFSLVLLSE